MGETCKRCECASCQADDCGMGRTPCGQNLLCHAPVIRCHVRARFEKKVYDAACDDLTDEAYTFES